MYLMTNIEIYLFTQPYEPHYVDTENTDFMRQICSK